MEPAGGMTKKQWCCMRDKAELIVASQLPEREELEVELSRRRMRHFVKYAWPHIEPGRPFVPGWHIDAICDHLQAVVEGGIKRIIINIPPRHMKSIACSVAFPTWAWLHQPNKQFLYASYAQSLSIRDSLKCRRLIQSQWYQRHFGHIFRLTSDQNQKQRYDNDQNGYRLATSVGGALTGEGGDFLILDDCHNAMDAESEAIRESTLEWWDMSMSTRLNDAVRGAFVVIMQRVHERDIVGHILAKEKGWDHLILPAEYERKPMFELRSSLGFADPRKDEGQLLWPERFPQAQIDELKAKLGSYGAAAQLQQRPAPSGGGLIKRDYFELWPSDEPLPVMHYVIQSYDTAYTDRTTGDPTACTTWGIFYPEKSSEACVMLLDAWSEHLLYPDLRRRCIKEYNSEYGAQAGEGNKGRKPDIVLIEDKGSGQSLKVDLARAGVPVRSYNPYRMDKTARVHVVLPILERGRVYLLESQRADKEGEPVAWAEPFLKECMHFPKGEHDDYVDTMTQALIMLHDSNFLSIDIKQDDDDNDPPVARSNPYAL